MSGLAVAAATSIPCATDAWAGPNTILPLAPQDADALAALEAEMAARRPAIFLLETRVPDQFRVSEGSAMRIVADRAKVGRHSLRWDYKAAAELSIHADIAYNMKQYVPGLENPGQTVGHFAFWVYNERPTDEPLRVEFHTSEGNQCWFDFHLGFTGWRTAWVRYGYDTVGEPRPDMNKVVLRAPRTGGTLWLDNILLNSGMRGDHACRDLQVPTVQKGAHLNANYHWLALLDYDELLRDPGFDDRAPNSEELAGLQEIESRVTARLDRRSTPSAGAVDELTRAIDAMGIPKPVDPKAPVEEYRFETPGAMVNGYQTSIWPGFLRARLVEAARVVGLRPVNELILTAAQLWLAAEKAGDAALAERAGDEYVRLLAYMREQGWSYGSSQGTTHHVGYQVREWFSSLHVARPLLEARGHWDDQRRALEWYAGLGRLTHEFDDDLSYSGLADILNTLTNGLLVACLVGGAAAERVTRLRAFKQWLDLAFDYSPGTLGGFKPDGTLFHHMGAYSAYARDGLGGSTPPVNDLRLTTFALGAKPTQVLRTALLTQRRIANTIEYPHTFTGRHPTGVEGMGTGPAGLPEAFGILGANPWRSGVEYDVEMAAAYRRLLPALTPTDARAALEAQFAAAGIEPEDAPNGYWSYGYAAAGQMRHGEWSATVRGHNHHLWSTEIYNTDNTYGRYQTYGQIEVQGLADERGAITHAAHGWVQPGYDWNHIPGATTIVLPFDELHHGGGTQMPMTESQFGGAGALRDHAVLFGMELLEAPLFEGRHRAKVSVLMVEDRIVALGSDIHNESNRPTHTTLFQISPETMSDPGAVVAGDNWVVDPVGHGYLALDGSSLQHRTAPQYGPADDGRNGGATREYALGWIDHGVAPQGSGYAYAQLVFGGEQATRELAARATRAFTVVQRDGEAHVVHDVESKVEAHTIFAGGVELAEGSRVRSASRACLVLARPAGRQLKLSVTDPNLHFSDGPDTDQWRGDRYVGRSPYDRPWKGNESRPVEVVIELEGEYDSLRLVSTEAPAAPELRRHGGRTTVTFTLQHAAPVEVMLGSGRP
ncbi:chondroitin-sulfate-ABC endolyase/exolyase [Tessaracoccus oleiagri]|uniref:Chondroitin-sulfate-ABC endolyase/exolyase n=2 Tax=Tessaracoccus oleiagri TaxID=686624 RepID=A0A1G9N1E5_9ACTN|nr:chondroitin-sulfate-ABC endolyase/exolyase [Tessaracoccus oleiagri]